MYSLALKEKIIRFSRLIHQTYGLPFDDLVGIVRDRSRYSPRFRAAALRHVVAGAPVSVTGGQPFAASRRLVRKHYAI